MLRRRSKLTFALGGMSLYWLVQLTYGCAGQPDHMHSVQLREQLRSAMQASVKNRAERSEQNRLLAKVIDADALDGMTRPEVRSAFGPGIACAIEVCRKNGFEETDWYYEIGVMDNPALKQLPLVLFKFDTHDRTMRVFALSTD
jgi:hypothetical protein